MTTENTNESIILVTLAVPNPAEQDSLAIYGKGSGPLIAQYGGKGIARLRVSEHLHGNSPAMFISFAEFPNGAAAKGFFESEDYKKLIPARDKGLKSVQIYFSAVGQSAANISASGKPMLVTLAMPNMVEKASLGNYQQGAGPLFGKAGAKPLAKIDLAERYYGDTLAAFISLAAFENVETIKAVFDSDAYKALIPARDKGLSSLNLYIAQ